MQECPFSDDLWFVYRDGRDISRAQLGDTPVFRGLWSKRGVCYCVLLFLCDMKTAIFQRFVVCVSVWFGVGSRTNWEIGAFLGLVCQFSRLEFEESRKRRCSHSRMYGNDGGSMRSDRSKNMIPAVREYWPSLTIPEQSRMRVVADVWVCPTDASILKTPQMRAVANVWV